MELIREETLLIGNKLYTIIVEYDGEYYIASGYLEGNLINQTQQIAPENIDKFAPNGSEIENLIYLIKEDFRESEL